jgi:hypothetical protein
MLSRFRGCSFNADIFMAPRSKRKVWVALLNGVCQQRPYRAAHAALEFEYDAKGCCFAARSGNYSSSPRDLLPDFFLCNPLGTAAETVASFR